MKKILIISLLIAILSLSTVAAQENSTDIIDIAATQDVSDEILTDETNDEILNENINGEIQTDEANDEILNEDINDEVLTENAPNNALKENRIYEISIGDVYVKDHELPTFISIDTTSEMDLNKIDIYVDGNYYGKYWFADGTGTPFDPWEYSVGEHVISAKYEWDDFLFENTTFKVIDYKISIPNNIDINDQGYVSIDASNNVNGTVTVYINGTEYEKRNITKYNLIYLNGLELGTYEIKVVYSGDENHPEATETKIVNVTYEFNVYITNGEYDFNASIFLPEDVNTTPIATIEGKTYPCEKIFTPTIYANFKVSIPLSELDSGTHYLNITYPGDKKYPQRTILKEIEVVKQNITPPTPTTPTTPIDENKQNFTPIINFNFNKKEVVRKSGDYSDYCYLTIRGIPETECETIKIYIDNEYVTNYWECDFMGTPLSAWDYPIGEHVITAVYEGNSEYNPFAINTTFKVVPYLITIPDEIDINSQEYVKIEASNSVTGTVAVYINGTECGNITLSKLNYVPLNNLKSGIYEIKVVYSGNGYHPEATETKIVNTTYGFNFYDCPDNYYYNATLLLPVDVNNTPIATIDGKTYPFEKDSFSTNIHSYFDISIDLSEFPSGDYHVNITYPGDDKYTQKTVLRELNITRPNSSIEAENVTVEYGMPIVINVTLENATMIKYQLIDANNNIINENTSDEINLDDLKLDVGEYTLNITTVTDGRYNEKTVTSTLTILKSSTNVTANAEDSAYLETVTVNVIGNVNGTAIVKIDDNATKTVDIIENTVVQVTFENVPVGKHHVSVVLKPASDNYNESVCSSEFTVSKKQAAVTVVPVITAKNTKVLYTAKGKYTVTVYGKDGELASGVEVVFKIGGKQVAKVKTTSKGTATYIVTKNPGTYKITASALGISKTKTLTVKHLVTLKKVTPKKSAKKLVLTATLAKVNGKYLKNKQISFKFKGKVYKAKTNKKGVAKVTIKPSVLKKLKVGKKITYQATYKKDTVKQTVKIKK